MLLNQITSPNLDFFSCVLWHIKPCGLSNAKSCYNLIKISSAVPPFRKLLNFHRLSHFVSKMDYLNM